VIFTKKNPHISPQVNIEGDHKRKKATEDDDVLDLLEENDNMKLTHVNGSQGVVENKTSNI
jgi:hypothetical protein